jgi:hypothetical protein
MYDVLDELGYSLRLKVDDGSDLDPLGELVDSDQKVVKPPRGLLNSSTMLRHQTTNDQVMGIVWSAYTGRWFCLV